MTDSIFARLRRRADYGLYKTADGMMPAGVSGNDPGASAPPADPSGGGSPVPGVAPDQPMDIPQPQPGMMAPGGQPGMGQPGMPGMMPPQAPKVKIDPGSVIIQCIRMMSAVLEDEQGKQSGNELVDPGVIQAALTQVQNSMPTLVQQGEGGKSKVDINNGLVLIQKLAAAMIDAKGIPMPASHMVATPDEMMAQQQQPGGAMSGGGAGGAAGGGQDPSQGIPGMPTDPIQPIDPLQGKQASDAGDGVAMPAMRPLPSVRPMNQSILSRLNSLKRS